MEVLFIRTRGRLDKKRKDSNERTNERKRYIRSGDYAKSLFVLLLQRDSFSLSSIDAKRFFYKDSSPKRFARKFYDVMTAHTRFGIMCVRRVSVGY